MPALKADIITQLKKDILALQGFRPLLHQHSRIELGTINHSFPNSVFPLGVNHEFICNNNESLTASSGFIAGILSSLLKKSVYAKASADRGGAVVWISSSHTIFPPALASFGINPAQFIFIRLRNRNQILWTIEEALKCEGLTAVVGEPSFIDPGNIETITTGHRAKWCNRFFITHQSTNIEHDCLYLPLADPTDTK
jgi:protein ImuA